MKTKRMIKSIFALFILMGLMAVVPHESKAATSDRIPIDKVEATSDISKKFGLSKSLSDDITFKITTGRPAIVESSFWQVKVNGRWVDSFKGSFSPGTWRVVAAAKTEGDIYTLAEKTDFWVDGKKWTEGETNYVENYYVKEFYSPEMKILQAPAPKSISVKLSDYNSIKVQWSKVARASEYSVYYREKSSSQYNYYGTTSKTEMTLKKRDCGKQYFVKVFTIEKADGKIYLGGGIVSPGIYTLNKVGQPTVTKYASKKVKVKWQGTPRSSGYLVRVTQKTTFRKYHSDFNVKEKTKAIFKVKRKKRFYYRVREYRVVDGKKIYGPWSKEKSYKLK